MDAQGFSGLRVIAVILLEHPIDKSLLKFCHCIGKKNSVLNHAIHERFKLVFHGSAPLGRKFVPG